MSRLSQTITGMTTVVLALGLGLSVQIPASAAAQEAKPAESRTFSDAQQTALVKQYCVTCHTEAEKPGGLSFESFAGVSKTPANIAALMARKLKAGQMPPPGMPRPDTDTLNAFISVLEAAAVPGMAGAGAAAPATGPQIIPFTHTGDMMTVAEQNRMVHTICIQCHTDKRKPGGISFEHFDMAKAPDEAQTAERMLAKLRAGMMPPADAPKRPDNATIHAFVVSLEQRIDREAALHPDPGSRLSQRLNRAEYAGAIKAMLGLDVDVSQWLPPDTMSHNFDNMAAVQDLSPTLLQSYLDAADEISRLAVGDTDATPRSVSYSVGTYTNQMQHVAGTPMGSRGGVSVLHLFPADGTYTFKIVFYGTLDGVVGHLFGMTSGGAQIELSLNGRRVALLDVPPTLTESEQGLAIKSPPIYIPAGQQRLSAAFVSRADGPVDDIITPQAFMLADADIGSGQGVYTEPHVRTLTVTGPLHVTGVSKTVSRERIFICRPVSSSEESACARKIVANLAGQAYRRPATSDEVDALLKFYREGRASGDFEDGVRVALQAILSSTHFLFRVEPRPAVVRAGQTYRISDIALASRLSYFLWASPPDAALVKLAMTDRLHVPAVLDAQVKRMLKDPRAFSLSTRFASEWLRLQDVDKVHPDPLLYPNFTDNLADEMKRETQELFNSIVTHDASVLDLLTADYTYVNQDLAAYYGLRGVAGPQFRRVSLASTERRGILGEGAIQVETSVADRSDPVLRGKWVLEVLLGQPPPPPPPNVNTDLDDSAKAVQDGKPLSVRQRMEQHRANPFCASCHRVIDPIGLALENFDPSGHWRIRDNGVNVDTETTLYDGTAMNGPAGLVQAMLKHQDTFVRVFTENLMAYSLGRQIEYYDMPTIRAIIRRASVNGNHFSSYVLGIVHSDAFQMSKAAAVRTTADERR
jgi:mono/diheme cytochrome c family protein